MALFKANDIINLNKEKKRLVKGDEIELTVKRGNEINKKYKEKYKKDNDILDRVGD